MKPKNILQPRLINLLIRTFFSFATLASVLTLIPVMAHALTPVTVAWDENNPVPEGYILHWGTTSGIYTNSHDAGTATEYTVPDLQEGVTYYFAATAYDDAGNESGYSTEISHTVGLITHTITASAGSHGSISPAGAVDVTEGASRGFTITPDQDYQVLEVRVDGTLIGTATAYTFNDVTADHTITASFVYVDPNPDSDGDGVPDAQDAFPQDANETTDTDGDGTGNNADEDDDDDGMPDAWEIVNNLDPLDADDAAGDPDDDGISNLDEYTAGTGPHTYEDPSVPDAPVILNLLDNEVVSLTPELTADEFYDPDIDDTHAESRWMIFRAADNFCVFDVTSPSSLTALLVPKLILEEDTEYTWKVKFINNHDAESDWSEVGAFTTDFIYQDLNGNGIPDSQEVAVDLDLDNDGVIDSEQADIKSVNSEPEDVQIGISVAGSENASIISMEIEEIQEPTAEEKAKGKPQSIQFGLIDFKILVNTPGDETTVTIHLSKGALEKGILYKYDPINDQWLDYSDYAEFSKNRKTVYLTLKDGGFGDADGVENGIIVDPLTIAEPSGGGGGGSLASAAGEVVENISPWEWASCFISTANQDSDGGWNIWSEIRGRELAILFALILFGLIGRIIFNKLKEAHGSRLSSFRI